MLGLVLVSASGGARSAARLSQSGGTGDVRTVGEGSPGNAGVRRLAKLDVRILEGVAVGTSTVQLASLLHLSRQGVEYRIGLMLRQFQVANRAALVSRAHSLGVLSVGAWPPRVLPAFLEQ
ncbi:LuxR C-terminal-related transcriptional regulator [Streptomyces sp. NBC_00690]|uniref:LuxR C-terminal-related transcriptional regulator n=1 Tax=Streptomyces sp. NBC_00690 TaxID=2975808 RepID=UPI002E2E354E|nr:LuxR C-terminal-related transcriptional regulator [Streptomyces sp. NBC_00690]